ncbi:DUF6241 domain-containing protein [Halobacillus rhizosphaerae]|uniref:DUF6241 domain-containing protein n=1 Tax=Halobacillus rhizosphaerae TaxID=3064889 RepID=UPI00398A8C46
MSFKKTLLIGVPVALLLMAGVGIGVFKIVNGGMAGDHPNYIAEVPVQKESLNDVKVQIADIKEVPGEAQFQATIHAMSHQKVEADRKWGAERMTQKKIDRLLGILKKAEEVDAFKHPDLYENILIPWSKGNFSNAVEAHNAIWDLQGGSIGKATGLLSDKEEENYIKKNFDD